MDFLSNARHGCHPVRGIDRLELKHARPTTTAFEIPKQHVIAEKTALFPCQKPCLP
jgi:hypothetical protein